MRCDYVERGCPWEGTVGTLKEHVDTTCQFTLLPCPKKCKDDKGKEQFFTKKDLQGHLQKDCFNRDHKCQYCGEKGTFAAITQVHDKTCLKKILPCTNTQCLKKLQHQHIDHHVEYECEYTEVACKHESIGCDTQLMRKDMAAHEENDTLHLHMAINTITLLQEKCALLKREETVTIKFADYEKKKKSNREFTSPTFYTSQGYHLAIEVHANGDGKGKGTHLSIFVPMYCKESTTLSSIGHLSVQSLTITLLNQLQDKNHHRQTVPMTKERNARKGNAWGCPEFIPLPELGHDPVKNRQYLKDDTLYLKVDVKVDQHKPWLNSTSPGSTAQALAEQHKPWLNSTSPG